MHGDHDHGRVSSGANSGERPIRCGVIEDGVWLHTRPAAPTNLANAQHTGKAASSTTPADGSHSTDVPWPQTHPINPCPLDMLTPRLRFLAAGLLFCLVSAACDQPDPAEEVVRSGIEAHGGELFEAMEVRFTFRDAHFTVWRHNGAFRYERVYTDDEGSVIRDWMTNEETGQEVDGERQPLTAQERASVETAVNSVVYFGLLPFRLLDDAARHRDLGTTEIEGRTYRTVEVTFDREGGGADWEDRFVYWFDDREHTLDYLAYRYHRDGGGTRFRRAVNRRNVGGLLLQDYENYTAAVGEVDDIADYDRLLARGELQLVSTIALEEVEVRDLR